MFSSIAKYEEEKKRKKKNPKNVLANTEISYTMNLNFPNSKTTNKQMKGKQTNNNNRNQDRSVNRRQMIAYVNVESYPVGKEGSLPYHSWIEVKARLELCEGRYEEKSKKALWQQDELDWLAGSGCG